MHLQSSQSQGLHTSSSTPVHKIQERHWLQVSSNGRFVYKTTLLDYTHPRFTNSSQLWQEQASHQRDVFPEVSVASIHLSHLRPSTFEVCNDICCKLLTVCGSSLSQDPSRGDLLDHNQMGHNVDPPASSDFSVEEGLHVSQFYLSVVLTLKANSSWETTWCFFFCKPHDRMYISKHELVPLHFLCRTFDSSNCRLPRQVIVKVSHYRSFGRCMMSTTRIPVNSERKRLVVQVQGYIDWHTWQ